MTGRPRDVHGRTRAASARRTWSCKADPVLGQLWVGVDSAADKFFAYVLALGHIFVRAHADVMRPRVGNGFRGYVPETNLNFWNSPSAPTMANKGEEPWRSCPSA
jgi:hypothetical protein